MPRSLTLWLIVLLTGITWIITASYAHYYRTLYDVTRTALSERCDAFDLRLTRLQNDHPREFVATHVGGLISTTDHPADSLLQQTDWPPHSASQRPSYAITIGKGNKIVPELRIPLASTNEHEFIVALPDQMESAAGTWLAHFSPYAGLEQFEEFTAHILTRTNAVMVRVRLKPDASISMRFTLVVLHQHRRFGQPLRPANGG